VIGEQRIGYNAFAPSVNRLFLLARMDERKILIRCS